MTQVDKSTSDEQYVDLALQRHGYFEHHYVPSTVYFAVTQIWNDQYMSTWMVQLQNPTLEHWIALKCMGWASIHWPLKHVSQTRRLWDLMNNFFPNGNYDGEKNWFDNLFPFKLNWTRPQTKFFLAHGQSTFEPMEAGHWFFEPIFIDSRLE